ncbi:cation/H(+) antiporter 15 isoform X2 [Ziziphus jujuba]|uniref:Cation/H(+) antiporter 15 isoform X2 n=1 Tax=Ziziphus jujuba TaxID=326968 RepID=A0A6P6FZU3_ZIZJJ|nr:cation/H(+) antiporter 15 isoform X2 [Ziziphus jujuba]
MVWRQPSRLLSSIVLVAAFPHFRFLTLHRLAPQAFWPTFHCPKDSCPSVLGRDSTFASKVFPPKGRTFLETLSVFGFMLCIFLIGVKMDPNIILKSGKKPVAIGSLAVLLPYAMSGLLAIVLKSCLSLDPDLSSVLQYVVTIQSMTAFPNVACFLDELSILNSEIGRIASSSSVVSDACHFCIVTIKYFTYLATERSVRSSVGSFFSLCFLFAFIFFGVRPAAMWAVRQTPEGQPVKEIYIFAIIIVVLVCGFVGEVIGLNAFAASFLLGLVIPDGHPLGAALVERLDCFVSVLLMPIFFTMCGLRMDVFAIQHLKTVAIIELIVFVAIFWKIIGTIVPPLVCRMPVRDAFSLGLIMNTKGIVELSMLFFWKSKNRMNEECFSILIITVVFVMVILAPLVRVLYDPSKRFLAYKRRTIMHHAKNEELRILVCIHRQDNVPPSLDLLAATNPTEMSPINLVVLHLVKLVGRSSSLLVPYVPREKSSQYPTQSERIFNAFRKLEQNYSGQVIVHCFKGISPYPTMHNDVCSLALEKRSTLIIIPFIKRFTTAGKVESCYAFRHLNENVLDKAPCSVGVLVDQGNPRTFLTSHKQSSLYRVVVLFLGGADDREAAAYAGRMSGHPKVHITLIVFSSSTQIVEGTERSKALDTETLTKFRLNAFRNERVCCKEQTVSDANGLLSVLKTLDSGYELVMVGRNHGSSRLMFELRKGRLEGELGTIGEILVTTEIRGGASVLVVQQQTRFWGLRDPEESTHLRKVDIGF